MNPRRFATMAAVVVEAAFVACVVGISSTGTEGIGATQSLTADAPQATAIGNVAVDHAVVDIADVATVNKSEPATDEAVASDEPVSVAEPVVTEAAPTPPVSPPVQVVTVATPQAPPPEATRIQLASAGPSQTLPSETPPAQVATVSAPNPEPAVANQAVSPLEIADECLVVDVCIDRYLWALYQRTPKEDNIKEEERRKVKVKKKGKLVTVTKIFTTVINEDFAWKDPKAAEKAHMSMIDYVIGGMDRSFKVKLFHMLYAAEQAGLSPGITSAFRDDYRQWIASGLKAATDRSYHGGSFRGGYGHGLAADVVSVKGATRAQRQISTDSFWKWVDAHGKEFGIGRPYLDHDPPHVAPIDGKEYADHRGTAVAAR